MRLRQICALFLLLGTLAAAVKFHPTTPSGLPKCKHTHVRLSGTVTLVRREADGDLHIRISDGKAFIVAECIPQLPCKAPRQGQRVTVEGISRKDSEHGWYEVHPVLKLEAE